MSGNGTKQRRARQGKALTPHDGAALVTGDAARTRIVSTGAILPADRPIVGAFVDLLMADLQRYGLPPCDPDS